MEIVDFLQLALLLGLLLAIGLLLTCIRRTHRLRDMRDRHEATDREELRLRRNRARRLLRNAPTRQWAKNWVGG